MTQITRSPLRQTIQARFAPDLIFDGPVGTTIEQFIEIAQPEVNGRIVAALQDGKLRELTTPLTTDADIVPITTASSDGMRIYRRSLSFLLITAAAELWPNRVFAIHHSMPFGGYYCECDGGEKLTTNELQQLRQHMQALVKAKLPIKNIHIPLEQALDIFRQSGDDEKRDLFANRRKDYLTLYQLNDVRDYFHGFMVPHTGYFDLFDLREYNNGFILQFPRRHQPEALQPFTDAPILAKVFSEYTNWLQVIEVPSVASLNNTIRNGRIQEVILVAEALHQRQLSNIAREIREKRPSVKLVLISGPTSAGKTTFSKRLAIQLMARGIHPITLGMDNYFVDRHLTPRDEHGEYNFEAIEAINTPLFSKHLQALLAGETIVQPIFDFHSGTSSPGEKLSIRSDQLIIIEGIHGLNPSLTEGLPPESIYRIFISAFTQLNLDKHNRVPTTDTRLLRRIVRDAAHRGYTASDTIGRWLSVRRGEKRYIFPHQHHANVFFNSALVYELSVLKALAYPLLLQVEPGTPERIEANRLIAFLQWFDPMPTAELDTISGESIVREFIGGSILRDYEPWYS